MMSKPLWLHHDFIVQILTLLVVQYHVTVSSKCHCLKHPEMNGNKKGFKLKFTTHLTSSAPHQENMSVKVYLEPHFYIDNTGVYRGIPIFFLFLL